MMDGSGVHRCVMVVMSWRLQILGVGRRYPGLSSNYYAFIIVVGMCHWLLRFIQQYQQYTCGDAWVTGVGTWRVTLDTSLYS